MPTPPGPPPSNSASPGGTATVTGHMRDNGVPVPNVTVRLVAGVPVTIPLVQTGADGAFSVGGVPAGLYRVEFSVAGAVFYSPGAVSFFDATAYQLGADQTLVLEESVPAHGVLTGTVHNTDGTAASNVEVSASGTAPGGNKTFGMVRFTGVDGRYSFPYAWAPVSYTVSFRLGTGRQWAHQKLSVADADRFAVDTGQTTVVDEVLFATGTIAGRFTNQGLPVAFAFVSVLSPTGAPVASAVTGADGTYSMILPVGTYVVQFRAPNGTMQFAHQQPTIATAERFTVTAGQTVVVDEQVITPATIRGTLRNPDGTAASFLGVTITDGASRNYNATPGPGGTWQAQVLPGTYRVAFRTAIGQQYAFGRTSLATADPIEAVANQTTVVDDVLAAPATLTVTAREHRGGAAVSSFCVSAGPANSCTSTGSVTTTLLAGHLPVFVRDPSGVLLPETVEVDLVSGQNTAISVELLKAARVTTVIRDAATGAPVGNACLRLVEPLRPFTLGATAQACSAPDGTVTLPNQRPGVVNAFIEVRDGVHGMQWVGLNRGTGAQARARLVLIAEGATVTLPDIRLDRKASVSGVVRDAASGLPVPNTYAGLSSFDAGFGLSGVFVLTDSFGQYTLDDLGPYPWTLFFNDLPGSHASVFSGGTGDRYLAAGVALTAGQTTSYDVSLRAGTLLTGTVTPPAGATPGQFRRITLVHALSGDELDAYDIQGTGPYAFPVAGPLLVKLKIDQAWVGGEDFLHADVFVVGPEGTTVVNL
jgi:hypothetical protein